MDNLFRNNDEGWYSFQKQKVFDHGLNICLFHEKNGVLIERRNLNTEEDVEDEANNYGNIWIQNSYHLKVQEVYYVPMMMPINLYLCCADIFCFHQQKDSVSGIMEKITEANVIGCDLCKLLVCSNECLTKYKLCLKCADTHLCSNNKICKEYKKPDQWPGWLLRKKEPVTDSQTVVPPMYCTFIECHYSCDNCDARICVSCFIPTQNKQLCFNCTKKVKKTRRSK